jgi:NAD(P)-dependent dehydrogenase (short-subunit alcohol dehydrogenase family)
MRPLAPVVTLVVVLVSLAWSALGLAGATQSPQPTHAPAKAGAKGVAVVTGANRGIGLEFARQLKAEGYEVVGTARNPDEAKELAALGVRVMQLDVTDAASVARLAEALKVAPIELLVNNAGVTGGGASIEAMDIEGARRAFEVNAIGPMRVTQALLPHLKAGSRRMVVSISSRLGSIAKNESGGYAGYRESKAALNMFMRSLSVEMKPSDFICIAMSPGWVRTDMGGSSATLSPEESVSGMLRTLHALTPKDSGRYLSHDGTELPW